VHIVDDSRAQFPPRHIPGCGQPSVVLCAHGDALIESGEATHIRNTRNVRNADVGSAAGEVFVAVNQITEHRAVYCVWRVPV